MTNDTRVAELVAELAAEVEADLNRHVSEGGFVGTQHSERMVDAVVGYAKSRGVPVVGAVVHDEGRRIELLVQLPPRIEQTLLVMPLLWEGDQA